jgi:hypothetical protein
LPAFGDSEKQGASCKKSTFRRIIMFSPSGFRDLLRPSYCERRVWLASNRPDLAIPDVDFVKLVQEKGIAAEEAHVQTVGPVETPEYPEYEFPTGFEETLKMIESKVPIIYQGILISKDNVVSQVI